MDQAALWDKIQTFRVGSGTEELTFVQRLARENGWTLPYADRVYAEYLRFIFLAMVSEQPVTPSDQIDQAWHLHLCYSRSYWNDLCKDVLQRPLHHGPTAGGEAESSRYREQYSQTLVRYAEAFGHPAPRDIWPPVRKRFARRDRFERVNRGKVFIVPKRVVVLGACTTVAATLLAGCEKFWEQALTEENILIALVVILVLLFIWGLFKKSRNRRNGSCCSILGCGGCSSDGCGGDGGCGGD